MASRVRMLLQLFLLLLCLAVQFPEAHAETVRVGISTEHRPLEFATAQGVPSGVLVDLWQEWGQQNGYKVNFVASRAADLRQLLDSGRADLIANAQPGEELVYSEPYSHLDFYLFAKKNRYLDSLQSLPVRVGLLRMDEPFLRAVLQDITRPLVFETYQELLEAIQAGTIDFMATNDLNLNFSVVDDLELLRLNYPQTPFYAYPVRAAALPERAALVKTFDLGIQLADPAQLEAINSKWVQSTLGYRLPWPLIGFALIVLVAAALVIVIWIMNLKLEQKVAAQTLVLEGQKRVLEQDIERRKRLEEELTQAKSVADAATDAKSNFLANMTHELRTPLIGVLGMTELLIATPLSERQKNLALTVQRSGEVLLSLVRDILDFSKIESKQLTLTPAAVDLAQIVEETSLLFAEKAAEQSVSLVCQVAPEALWEVSADPLRLRQILMNLIGNAVKFTERGEVVVRLDMAAGDASTGLFTIEVEDTGIGMSDDDQKQIFAPFVQIDNAATRAFEGTGLGLAIVRQLVDLMGGSLTVASQLGKGSRFRVQLSLPLLTHQPAYIPERLRGCRVLVQAENRLALESLRTMLVFLQVEVTAVATGTEAWRILQDGVQQAMPFDIVMFSPTSRVTGEGSLYDKIIQAQTLATLQTIMLCTRLSMLNIDELPELPMLEMPVTWGALVASLCNAAQDHRRPVEEQLLLLAVPAREHADQAASMLLCGRILVVDDYAVTRDLVKQFLEPYGLVIDEAGSGKEVLKKVETTRYGLILMDCNMPEMDGMETTRLLRKQGHRVPITALTAHVDSRIHEECLEAGMDDCLLKPFRRAELEALVNKWLYADVESAGLTVERVGGAV